MALIGCANLLGIEARTLGPGRCEGVIHLRVAGAYGGPRQGDSLSTIAGIVDRIAYINDIGGIRGGGKRGCKIEIQYADTGLDAGTALQAYEAWGSGATWPAVSTIFLAESAGAKEIASKVAEDERVLMVSSFAADFAAPQKQHWKVSVPKVNDEFQAIATSEQVGSEGFPNVFMVGTDYSTGARAAMAYVNSQDAKRVGFFHCGDENPDFCRGPLLAAKHYLVEEDKAQIGRELVVSLTPNEAQLETDIRGFFDLECQRQQEPNYEMIDWLWFGNDRASAATTAKVLKRIFDDPPQDCPLDVKVIASNRAVDEELYADSEQKTAGRWWGIQPVAVFGDETASGMKNLMSISRRYPAFLELENKQYYVTKTNTPYVYGYVTAMAWQRAAELLVVEGYDISGPNIKASLERLRGETFSGLTADSITIGPDDHRAQLSERVYRITESGTLEVVEESVRVARRHDWLGW